MSLYLVSTISVSFCPYVYTGEWHFNPSCIFIFTTSVPLLDFYYSFHTLCMSKQWPKTTLLNNWDPCKLKLLVDLSVKKLYLPLNSVFTLFEHNKRKEALKICHSMKSRSPFISFIVFKLFFGWPTLMNIKKEKRRTRRSCSSSCINKMVLFIYIYIA